MDFDPSVGLLVVQKAKDVYFTNFELPRQSNSFTLTGGLTFSIWILCDSFCSAEGPWN